MKEKLCSHCNEPISEEFSFCMNCGQPVAQEAPAAEESPASQPQEATSDAFTASAADEPVDAAMPADEPAMSEPEPTMPPEQDVEAAQPVPQRVEGSAERKFKLVVVRGDGGQAASYSLGGNEHIAGRDEGVVLFPDDETVSPRHARFFYRDGQLFVTDEGSTNGTFVRISDPVQLKNGDRFVCGEQLFVLEEGGAIAPLVDETGTCFFGTPITEWFFKVVQVLKGGLPGNVHCARKDRVTIGREKCDFAFPDDKFMSHRHASVELRDGKVWLIDAKSRNGAFIMLRSGEEQVLNEGDYIFLGRQLIRIAV